MSEINSNTCYDKRLEKFILILEGYQKSNHSVLKTDYEKFRATVSNNVNDREYTFEIDEHLFEIDLSQYGFIKTFYIVEQILSILILSFILPLFFIVKQGYGFLSSSLFLLCMFHFMYTISFYKKLYRLSKTLLK